LEALQLVESLSQLLGLFDALPENQQEVMRLKFEEGLSYREIGGSTGLSEGSVRSLLHRGIKKLREQHNKPKP
jgi:RNA polymerase sigma-70 factor (ECF subfamily)